MHYKLYLGWDYLTVQINFCMDSCLSEDLFKAMDIICSVNLHWEQVYISYIYALSKWNFEAEVM